MMLAAVAWARKGAMGVNEGFFQLQLDNLGLKGEQFDSYSGSLVKAGEFAQISLSAANDKGPRNVAVSLMVRGGAPGVYALGQDGNQMTLQASDVPRPEAAIMERVRSGSLKLDSYPAVGGFAQGSAEAVYEWLDEAMQPIRSVAVTLRFSVKRLS